MADVLPDTARVFRRAIVRQPRATVVNAEQAEAYRARILDVLPARPHVRAPHDPLSDG